MSDQTQSSNQQVIVYALVAIAVLLAAIVGFMIYNNSKTATTVAPVASATTGSDTTGAGAGAGMPPAASPVAFDTKTATKLPAGTTPEQGLKTYMEDIKSGKFTDAYALLPLAQKTSYGSAEAYGTQVKQYGITGYSIGKPATAGSDVTIVTQQDTPAMNITYTWVFTKDGNNWYIKSRTMGGSL
jgi:hypothetical protein